MFFFDMEHPKHIPSICSLYVVHRGYVQQMLCEGNYLYYKFEIFEIPSMLAILSYFT